MMVTTEGFLLHLTVKLNEYFLCSHRKFICLNSNLDPRSKDNDLIHALVQDTYESLFPVPSSFELPLNYRNRFLYVDELLAWRKWRDLIRALIYACLASLIFLTLINFFSTEVCNKWYKIWLLNSLDQRNHIDSKHLILSSYKIMVSFVKVVGNFF